MFVICCDIIISKKLCTSLEKHDKFTPNVPFLLKIINSSSNARVYIPEENLMSYIVNIVKPLFCFSNAECYIQQKPNQMRIG